MIDDFRNEPPESQNEEDAGEPLGALRQLEQEPSPNFLIGLRGKIHRRSLASQFASFAWEIPVRLLTEIWGLLLDLVPPDKGTKGGRL